MLAKHLSIMEPSLDLLDLPDLNPNTAEVDDWLEQLDDVLSRHPALELPDDSSFTLVPARAEIEQTAALPLKPWQA